MVKVSSYLAHYPIELLKRIAQGALHFTSLTNHSIKYYQLLWAAFTYTAISVRMLLICIIYKKQYNNITICSTIFAH